MPNDLHQRKVTRVLVMLEYEPGDPDNGEVFDLTALAEEVRASSHSGAGPGAYSKCIRLYVTSQRTFQKEGPEAEAHVSWCVEYGASAGHLTDAINAGMPDGPRVEDINAKVKRLRTKADKLEYEAKVAKLEQVAAIRAQHPIARVTATPLTDVPSAPALS